MSIKKAILAVLLVSSISSLMAQDNTGKGIQFFKGSWDELLKTAKAQKKMIFLDIYTDWCAPCKEMEKYIFTMELAGKKYNPLFLNYKINAEKGEGKDIAKKFNIRAYPTFLYLNSSGNLIHRVVGEMKAVSFNKAADEAIRLGADKNTLGNIEAEFAEGNRNPDFLKSYIIKMTELDVDNSKVLDEYFKTIPYPDLKKEETLLFIGQNLFGVQSSAFLFFIENYELLSRTSKEQLKPRLYKQLVDRALATAIAEKRFLEVDLLANYISKIGNLDEKQTRYLERLMLLYYDLIRDQGQVKLHGYQWAARYKDIPPDSIKSEDQRRYKNFITPFLNGTSDSTHHSDFAEVRAAMRHAYSAEIAFNLYYVASLFSSLPDTETQAFKDALEWSAKANLLDPKQKAYQEQVELLTKKINSF